MTTIPCAEYAPDKSDYDPTASDVIKNVVPTPNGYGPIGTFMAFTDALPDVCRGAILTRSLNGTRTVFAATAARIYKLSGTTWTNVTRLAGGDYSLATGDNWSAAQWGDYVIFTHVSDVPQVYTLGSSANFAALGGSPPQSRFVGVSGDYLLLCSTAAEPNRMRRSGVNDITHWVPKQRGSDYQDLPDGGWITGIAGYEKGAVLLQQDCIRVLDDQPGSAIMFSLTKTDPGRGCVAPGSVNQVGNAVYFFSQDGFYKFGVPDAQAIGANRVDKTVLADIDLNDLRQLQSAVDPLNKRIWWRYRSAGFGGSYSNKLLGYDWGLDRWTYAEVNLEWILGAATSGYTLEEVSSVLGYTSIEAIPFSFDSEFLKGGRPNLAGFNTNHRLGFFSGTTMEATVETNDFPVGGEGKRGFISGFRPIGEVTGVYGQIGRSDTYGGTKSWTVEAAQNATGLIPVQASGRTLRARMRIPADNDLVRWNHLMGIEVPDENRRGAGRQ